MHAASVHVTDGEKAYLDKRQSLILLFITWSYEHLLSSDNQDETNVHDD